METIKKTEQKKNLMQVVKFAIFSVSAGIIQTVAFTLMNEIAKVDYWLSYLVALTCSIVWNFTFNRKFTFKSASNVPKAMLLAFCFYLPFAPLSLWWGSALEKAGWNEYLVLFFTMAINLTTEFIWQKFVVFRDSYKREKEEMQQILGQDDKIDSLDNKPDIRREVDTDIEEYKNNN